MDSYGKRKLQDGEGSSSGGAAPSDWRQGMHSSIRVRNRALLAESLYLDPSEPIPVDEVLTTANWIEQGFYEEATSELDYLLMVSDNIQRGLRPEEISEEKGVMPQLDLKQSPASKQQKGKEPLSTDKFKDLIRRHEDTTGCLKNIMLLFNQRQPISVTSQRQLAVFLHKLRASIELVNALKSMKEQIEFVQKWSENNVLSEPVEIYLLEKAYEDMIEGFLETFSRHIKNICNCPRGVTVDVDSGPASVDLNSQMKHLDNSELLERPPLQPVQQPLAEVHSGGSRKSPLPPQQQKQQLGSNEDQTDTLLDDDLLAEIRAWLIICNK